MTLSALWRRALRRPRPERLASSSSSSTTNEAPMLLLPDSLIAEVYFFVVDECDTAALACVCRVLAECGSEGSVLSELARLGFSRARGLDLEAHDAVGASIRRRELKSAAHAPSWPATLTTHGDHGDIDVVPLADGLFDVVFTGDCKARSNRCVAGDRPFGGLGGPPRPTPGKSRGGDDIWRLAPGAYFEVELRPTARSKPIDSRRPTRRGPRAHNSARPCVAVGLATSKFNLRGKQPGWDHHSFAYHADDGLRFHGRGVGAPYGPPFVAGDVVGCGVFGGPRLDDAAVFYTLNGSLVDTKRAFGIPAKLLDDLYPVVGLDTNRLDCRVNFGISKPFLFDLDACLAHPESPLKPLKPKPRVSRLQDYADSVDRLLHAGRFDRRGRGGGDDTAAAAAQTVLHLAPSDDDDDDDDDDEESETDDDDDDDDFEDANDLDVLHMALHMAP